MKHITEEMVSAWVDEMLSPVEAGRVEEHLRECPACRQLASDIRDLCNALESLPEAPYDKALGARTLSAWKKQRRPNAVGFRWFELDRRWRALACSMVAAGLILGIFLGNTARAVIAPGLENRDQYTISQSVENEPGPDTYFQNLLSDDGGAL